MTAVERDEYPAASALRKRATTAFNLAGWDGDWETAAYEAHSYLRALETAIRAHLAAPDEATAAALAALVGKE